MKIIQNNQKENSFCAIIAQTPPLFLSDSLDESVVISFSIALPGGAIRSNKSAIMLSDTWGFSAGKHLPVDTVAHGNKLQATADAA